jgi:hypothetical protein
MKNIEQGNLNDEGKNARAIDLENRLIDLAPAFDVHYSLFDIRYCRALVNAH